MPGAGLGSEDVRAICCIARSDQIACPDQITTLQTRPDQTRPDRTMPADHNKSHHTTFSHHTPHTPSHPIASHPITPLFTHHTSHITHHTSLPKHAAQRRGHSRPCTPAAGARLSPTTGA
eukprot:2269255-Rhodomonas_salina.1